MDPALTNYHRTNEPIRQLATVMAAISVPREGPVVDQGRPHIPLRRHRTRAPDEIHAGQGAPTVALERPTRQRPHPDLRAIVSAEHLTAPRHAQEADGSFTVVANSFQGKRLLRSERRHRKVRRLDLFHRSRRSARARAMDVTVSGVYRVSADLGSMSLIVDDMVGPTGSPSRPMKKFSMSTIRAPSCPRLRSAGQRTVAKQTSRVFADLGGPERACPTA